jgi:hypothetical protein
MRATPIPSLDLPDSRQVICLQIITFSAVSFSRHWSGACIREARPLNGRDRLHEVGKARD